MSLLAAMFIRFAGFGYVIPRVQSDGRANWQSDQTISVRFNLDDLPDGSVAPRGRSNLVSI
jgi:hypothetical protein